MTLSVLAVFCTPLAVLGFIDRFHWRLAGTLTVTILALDALEMMTGG